MSRNKGTSKIKTAKLTVNNKTYELPIYNSTEGESVVDISKLHSIAKIFTYDPGFTSTASCESKITFIDGDKGVLRYRGYDIEELANKSDFIEIVNLLIYGDLPNKEQLKKYKRLITRHTLLHEQIINFFQGFRRDAHPMAMMVGVMGALSSFYQDTLDINDPHQRQEATRRIVAKSSTIGAMAYKYSIGQSFVSPKNDLSFSENFFHMCFGKVPNKDIVKAFDVSLILYAEHSFNVSTFTARTITSSLSDIHGAITGAIASLKGPLHGGANEEVMHMMNKIKKPENALKWINKALDNKDVVMGFGHRVYKSGDSRVPTMREYFGKVAKIKKDRKFEKIYDIVEKVMIDRKNIHPNVDYPTGPTYHLMGFDTDFFTPIFVISRITGWSAHIIEQHAANKLIRPLASYKGSRHRKVLQLNQR